MGIINAIFWGFMNSFAAILKCIIVFGLIGFILLLPFLLKGGWLLGIMIYGYLGLVIYNAFIQSDLNQERCDKHYGEHE